MSSPLLFRRDEVEEEMLKPTDTPRRQTSGLRNIPGGWPAIFVFIIILIAYVLQCQVSQYLQVNLHYRQPMFILYWAHVGFIFIFPLHLLYLVYSTKIPARRYLAGLYIAFVRQLSPKSTSTLLSNEDQPPPSSLSRKFPTTRLVIIVLWLTIHISLAAFLWYIAVLFAPVSQVTTIYNTNTFWAYFFSVYFGTSGPTNGPRRKWELHKLAAVVVACLGVVAVMHGSPASSNPDSSDPQQSNVSSTLLGDFIALVASVLAALYQVLYKKYAALPTIEEDAGRPSDSSSSTPIPSSYEPLLSEDPSVVQDLVDEVTRPSVQPSSPILRTLNPLSSDRHRINHSSSDNPEGFGTTEEDESPYSALNRPVYPPPFAFHPNFITSLIGVANILLVWIPIPIISRFHEALQMEPFAWPPNRIAWISVLTNSLGGAMYHGGFMILLGLWGPVTASVGSLTTTVLVNITDSIFGDAAQMWTFWTVVGSLAIVGSFSVLVRDMMQTQRS